MCWNVFKGMCISMCMAHSCVCVVCVSQTIQIHLELRQNVDAKISHSVMAEHFQCTLKLYFTIVVNAPEYFNLIHTLRYTESGHLLVFACMATNTIVFPFANIKWNVICSKQTTESQRFQRVKFNKNRMQSEVIWPKTLMICLFSFQVNDETISRV